MLSLLEQQENANYVRGRMCSLILLWERFYNVHLYENYHIVHLKLRRYLNKSVEWTWKDRKKGSKCHFCCEQGSIPGAEEKHVVHSLHLCFLAEFFQGACGRFLEGWSDAVQPNSIPWNRETLTGSVIPMLVFTWTCGGVDGWEADVGFGGGGNEP